MASLSATDCACGYVPAAGLNVGVATWIAYVAPATALVVYPAAAAIALIVCVVVTVIGPVYAAEAVVGVVPSGV